MRHFFASLFLSLFGLLLIGCGGASSAGGDRSDSTVTDTAGLLTVRLPLPVTDEGRDAARSYDTIRMGRIAEGEVLEGRFRVANLSERPLVIVQVITGCGCTTADYDPAPIAPGDTILMTWRFDSRGRLGQQFKSIEIITAERQCATVYLDGEVVLGD
ncbi:DUF1573 domain-containing protein [uncultured Rikenella sp.]|uniref:DUF1573 domain-containing protein n=1 Tax=uncultured Rikenella sp. TaxID=368003 RepID=UPI002606A1B8|nr:DUF1573 domain-containing protein [uncultured Rikenella sp.]